MAKNNNSVWIIVLIVVLAFFLFVMPFGGTGWGGFCGMMGGNYSSNYGWGMMGSWGGMAFGWMFMLVFLVALVLIIVWLVNYMQNQTHNIPIRNGRKR